MPITAGSSAAGVDVDEGTANAELRGRKWDVSVRLQGEVITQKMQLQGKKTAQKACAAQKRIDGALLHFGRDGAATVAFV